jgi:hypothetical protein
MHRRGNEQTTDLAPSLQPKLLPVACSPFPRPKVGDGVLVWMSGEAAGIYAIAEIIETPQLCTDILDVNYWLDLDRCKKDKPIAKIRFMRKLIGQPMRRTELRYDRTLKDLMVMRIPNSTNFKVTTEQWQRVYQLKC